MDYYLGEIRLFAGNYAPAGWLLCQGQLLSIQDYGPLATVLGTTYGGDGQNTFGLPDLQSRAAVGTGTGPGTSTYGLGTTAGQETVTLGTGQLPLHQHPVQAGSVQALTGGQGQASPAGAYFGDQGGSLYQSAAATGSLAPDAVTGQTSAVGGSQSHANIQPFLALNYIIATEGIPPTLT